jgi:ribbon-helix-helix CopG family protein
VYLTALQRERLDELTRRRGVPLAAILREAVDRYLADARPSLSDALSASFGKMPDLEVPSRDEWDDGGPTDRH